MQPTPTPAFTNDPHGMGRQLTCSIMTAAAGSRREFVMLAVCLLASFSSSASTPLAQSPSRGLERTHVF